MLSGGTERHDHPAVDRRLRCDAGPLTPCRRPGSGRPSLRHDRDGFPHRRRRGGVILEELEHATARRRETSSARSQAYGPAPIAHHTHRIPTRRGTSQARAMRAAILEAGIGRRGHRLRQRTRWCERPGDPSEIAAIRRVGSAMPTRAGTAVSATKAMQWTLLGATGAIEAVLGPLLSVADAGSPRPSNLADLDPDCTGVDHVHRSAARECAPGRGDDQQQRAGRSQRRARAPALDGRMTPARTQV